VKYGKIEISIAQCNNAYIFPAVGLALVASAATRVTDGMLLAAANALAANSPARNDPTAPLLPILTDVRKVAVEMAVAVGLAAQDEGLAPQTSQEELRRRVVACQWFPAYSDAGLYSDASLLEEVEVNP
jgi:malate dehydrogenase (oxaloacetate-decarboxylating)